MACFGAHHYAMGAGVAAGKDHAVSSCSRLLFLVAIATNSV
jgi:hypothetical protein